MAEATTLRDEALAELRGLKLTDGLRTALVAAKQTPGGALQVDSYGAALGALRKRGLVIAGGTLLTAKGAGARRLLVEGGGSTPGEASPGRSANPAAAGGVDG